MHLPQLMCVCLWRSPMKHLSRPACMHATFIKMLLDSMTLIGLLQRNDVSFDTTPENQGLVDVPHDIVSSNCMASHGYSIDDSCPSMAFKGCDTTAKSTPRAGRLAAHQTWRDEGVRKS